MCEISREIKSKDCRALLSCFNFDSKIERRNFCEINEFDVVVNVCAGCCCISVDRRRGFECVFLIGVLDAEEHVLVGFHNLSTFGVDVISTSP